MSGSDGRIRSNSSSARNAYCTVRGDSREGVAAVRVGVVGETDQDDGKARGIAAIGWDGGRVQRPVDGFDAHRVPPRMVHLGQPTGELPRTERSRNRSGEAMNVDDWFGAVVRRLAAAGRVRAGVDGPSAMGCIR